MVWLDIYKSKKLLKWSTGNEATERIQKNTI